MDILQEGNGKEAFRTLSDASFVSSANTQVKKPAATGRNMLPDPIVTSAKNLARRKVKFMCSSAGKILPRPSDLKLRYVGGETRMISVPRYIQYAAFFTKMVELYGSDIVVKYQLPEEDLDALVSVSSDEDLENMMEECDKLNTSEGSSKLRVFIFPSSELDLPDLEHMDDYKTSEQKFVDALNATVSADIIQGAHNITAKGKQYTTSDSFNDAYKAWNGIQSQEKGSIYFKDLHAGVVREENYDVSGNMHGGNVHASGAISPFSYSHFMGQSGFSNVFSAPDVFGNDSELSNLDSSSSFFQHGFGGEFTENDWPSRLDMPLPKDFTTNVRVQDTAHVAEQSVAMEGIKESFVKGPISGYESIDEFRDSHGNALHQNPLHLSPGALLQKQLLSTSPEAFHYRGNVLDSKHLEVDYVQPCPVNSIVRLQEDHDKASHEGYRLQSHYQWGDAPVFDSLALDRENGAFEQINRSSMGEGTVNPLAAPLHPREGLGIVFPASSGPSSPLGMSVQNERRFAFSSSEASEMAGVSSLDDAIPSDSSAQIFATAFATNTSRELNVEVESSGIPSNTTKQDSSDTIPWITAEKESYPLARPDTTIQLEGLSQINYQTPPVGTHSQIHSHAPPETTKHPQDLQENEGMSTILPFYGMSRTSGRPVLHEAASLGQNVDGVATVQSEDEHADRLSHHSDSRPADTADVHTLDMLSGLLESCQVMECLPAPRSTAESLKSRSLCSSEEAPLPQESGQLTARAARESLLTAVRGLDFPLSTEGHYDFSSFHTMQESLPVYDEQSDNMMASPYISTFNGTRHFAEESLFGNREDPTMSTSDHSRVPALTSLIKTWEASLLQDEDEQHTTMPLAIHERAEEDINSMPVYDKEEYRVEIEEVEDSEAYDYNAAAVAEQEAIARGLQIIRNCDLEELRELGSGTFGTVYHGKWRGTDVAIKRIKASCFAGRQAERDRLVADFWREAYILGQLHHPNVVAFYGVVPDGPGGTLATVTEYMVNGSLKQVLQNKDSYRTLDRRKRLLIAMDAAFGMEYLHGKNVVHFDIKCENLLVNLKDPQRPICKVGDLGLSKVKQQTFVSGGVRGTLPWMAPELLNGSSSLVSEKVDVFSFGIVMWELLTGEEPYANMHYGAIIGGIVNNTLRPTVPRWCDPAWRSLMEKCWAADPVERPTFSEIARTLRAMEASITAKGPGQARILEMYQ